METPRTDRVGLIVIIVAFVALAQLLFFTYQQRQDTQCQADINSAFLETLKQRSNINIAADESVEKLITDLTEAKTPEDTSEAIRQFNERKKSIIELRESFKYPNIQGACS